VPLNHHHVLDAVLGLSGDILHRAEGDGLLRRQCAQHALVARICVRLNHTGLTVEAFSASIDEVGANFGFSVCIELDQTVDHRVQPSARLHIVDTTNDNLELFEEVLIELLNVLRQPFNLDTGASFLDNLSSDLSLEPANVLHSEQELAIQVGQINRVHINASNVPDAAQG